MKYMLQWIIENMMVPGKIESWILIQDFTDVAIYEIPGAKIKAMSAILRTYFRGRLYRMIACNSHWMLRGFWGLVWTWIDKFTQ